VKQRVLKVMQAAGAFAPFRLANRNKALVLFYHRFSLRPQALATSAGAFAEQIEYLSGRYNLISLSELVKLISIGRALPPATAVITIDDAYADFYDIAFPILMRNRVPATLFAVTGFVDGTCWLWPDQTRYAMLESPLSSLRFELGNKSCAFNLGTVSSRLAAAGRINAMLKRIDDQDRQIALDALFAEVRVDLPQTPPREFSSVTWDQLRELEAGGIEVGSHSVSHPILTNISTAQLETELVESRSRLESELHHPVDLFCYPNGDYNAEVRRAVASAGYRAAVTTSPGFNDLGSDLLALDRFPTEHDLPHFAQSTSGFEQFRSRIGPPRRAVS
jgi:peptidoglycan/xylan/chitin deacetylase (PgdA/CDA1 family)